MSKPMTMGHVGHSPDFKASPAECPEHGPSRVVRDWLKGAKQTSMFEVPPEAIAPAVEPPASKPAQRRAAAKAKERGMAQADENAAPTFKGEADAAIAALARTMDRFTADDVWPMLKAETHDGRALGARFQAAARAGLIRKGGFTTTARESRHAAPVQVWESVERVPKPGA